MLDPYEKAVANFTSLSSADEASAVKTLRVGAAALVDEIVKISAFFLVDLSQNPSVISLQKTHEVAVAKSVAWSINALLARKSIEDSDWLGIPASDSLTFEFPNMLATPFPPPAPVGSKQVG